MEIQLKKFGNSTGLTLPPSLIQALGLSAGQTVTVNTTADGGILIQPKHKRKKYTAAQLNALCDLKAPMPRDLVEWNELKPVCSEAW